MFIQYSDGQGINFDWLNDWQCWTMASKTFEWRRVIRDLRKGGPLEMLTTCTISKLIKIKVLLHQFSNLMFNLHYMCLLSQISHQKYTNKFHS